MLEDNLTPHWYVVHTYSGYENKVAVNLEKIVENRKVGNLIHAIKIPMEKVPESEGGDGVAERKIFPSYVLVKMIMNDESWHIVRNTTGVTGFVGPGSMPVVLSDEEVAALGVESAAEALPFKVGDKVRVIGGPLAAHISSATVEEISQDLKKVKVLADLHGRSTKIELDSSYVQLF